MVGFGIYKGCTCLNWLGLFVPIGITHNKAFKSDSQRLAFFIPSLGFVYTVARLSFVVALLTP
ncbi:hypothetical protein CGI23_23780 [Vibrio parahaemolyticus]|nr:hypothetical protein CGI23_23780 [Vibrio parahaemolyticus]